MTNLHVHSDEISPAIGGIRLTLAEDPWTSLRATRLTLRDVEHLLQALVLAESPDFESLKREFAEVPISRSFVSPSSEPWSANYDPVLTLLTETLINAFEVKVSFQSPPAVDVLIDAAMPGGVVAAFTASWWSVLRLVEKTSVVRTNIAVNKTTRLEHEAKQLDIQAALRRRVDAAAGQSDTLPRGRFGNGRRVAKRVTRLEVLPPE